MGLVDKVRKLSRKAKIGLVAGSMFLASYSAFAEEYPVVFSYEIRKGNRKDTRIFLTDTAGKKPIDLSQKFHQLESPHPKFYVARDTHMNHPRISPDGDKIAFLYSEDALFYDDMIKRLYHKKIENNSLYFFYKGIIDLPSSLQYEEIKDELYIMNLDGSNKKRLTHHGEIQGTDKLWSSGDVGGFLWTPNSERIVYSRYGMHNGINIVDAETQDGKEICSGNVLLIDISPDGEKLVIRDNNDEEYCVISVEGRYLLNKKVSKTDDGSIECWLSTGELAFYDYKKRGLYKIDPFTDISIFLTTINLTRYIENPTKKELISESDDKKEIISIDTINKQITRWTKKIDGSVLVEVVPDGRIILKYERHLLVYNRENERIVNLTNSLSLPDGNLSDFDVGVKPIDPYKSNYSPSIDNRLTTRSREQQLEKEVTRIFNSSIPKTEKREQLENIASEIGISAFKEIMNRIPMLDTDTGEVISYSEFLRRSVTDFGGDPEHGSDLERDPVGSGLNLLFGNWGKVKILQDPETGEYLTIDEAREKAFGR